MQSNIEFAIRVNSGYFMYLFDAVHSSQPLDCLVKFASVFQMAQHELWHLRFLVRALSQLNCILTPKNGLLQEACGWNLNGCVNENLRAHFAYLQVQSLDDAVMLDNDFSCFLDKLF